MAIRHPSPSANGSTALQVPLEPALDRHSASVRLPAPLAKRDRLVCKLEKKRRAVTRARAVAVATTSEFLQKLPPLLKERAVLVAETAALFDEVLAREHLSMRARRQVRLVRQALEEDGFFETVALESLGLTDVYLESVLREINGAFRLHARKQGTHAFEGGEPAHQIAIETYSAAHPSTGVENEPRQTVLERATVDLRAQLGELGRELWQLQQATCTLKTFLADTEHEVARTRVIVEHVRAFRDGRISLASFVRGPACLDDEDLVELVEILWGDPPEDEDFALAFPTRKRGRRRARRPRRKKRGRRR
nr:MAG: hypothetical protein DIU78_21140 [Pseudomonadota bacterium]